MDEGIGDALYKEHAGERRRPIYHQIAVSDWKSLNNECSTAKPVRFLAILAMALLPSNAVVVVAQIHFCSCISA